ncbi:MAG: hypothetical protein AAF851_00665 [Myxococcota bacterium]
MSHAKIAMTAAVAGCLAFALTSWASLRSLTRSESRLQAILQRQSETSQRAAFEAHRYAREPSAENLADLRATMQFFSATQLALRLGGQVPLDRTGRVSSRLEPPQDARLQSQLVEIGNAWDRMTGRIELLIESARQRSTALLELERVNPRLLRKVSELNRLLEAQQLGSPATRDLAQTEAIWVQMSAKEALLYDVRPSPERRERLRALIERFDAGHRTLREGGRRKGTLIDALGASYAKGKLDEVQWLWIDQVDVMQRLTAAEDGVHEPLKAVSAAAPEVVEAVDASLSLASRLEEEGQRSSAVLSTVASVVGLSIMLLFLAWAVSFGSGMRRLLQAAEHVSTTREHRPLPVIGRWELATLSRSLERLRVSLQKTLELLERDRSGPRGG